MHKKYKFTINVRTKMSPSEALWYITSRIKDAIPLLSIDYDVVEDRPTTDEHHGGMQNEDT